MNNLIYRPDLDAVVHRTIEDQLAGNQAALAELKDLIAAFKVLLQYEQAAITELLEAGKPVVTSARLLIATKQSIIMRLVRLPTEDLIQIEPEISSDSWGILSIITIEQKVLIVSKELERLFKLNENRAAVAEHCNRALAERGPVSLYGEQRFSLEETDEQGGRTGGTVWLRVYLAIGRSEFFIEPADPPWQQAQ